MKKIIILLIAAVAIVVFYFYQKPKPAAQTSSGRTETQNSQPQRKTFDLVIKNKQLVSGPSLLEVNQGDSVAITITDDEGEELHLHGYDKAVELTANEPANLEFTADISGRFVYELENSGTEIGALEVQPK